MYGNDYNRPMKRAHSPDFENNYRGPYRGPPGSGGHPYHKRARGDGYQQPQTIEEKIVRLGDTGSRNVDIGILAKEIDAELATKVEEEEKMKNITTKICKCIVAFPTRIATYSTLIGLISVKHYNVSCQIINSLHASYPVYLEAQKWREAIIIIHFLASLVNCKVIRPSAILSQFEHMLEVTLEEQVPQARSDYYVYTVLSSLPYVALELSIEPETAESLEKILNTIEKYLGKRSKLHLDAIKVWQSDDSTIQMDYLDSLWVQMKNFKANGWTETLLHRPYNDKEYKDIMASSLIPQNSPTIQIPAYSENHLYPSPRIVLRVFEDDVTDGRRSIPGTDKIERFCIENQVRNIIDELPSDQRDCARHLSHMYRSDFLPIKHILIETILGELFTLPRPRHQEILYHTLLFELSKIFQPSRIPEEARTNFEVVLNAAMGVLYENLETFNITCLSRLIEWFTFHLNNTEFIFPWQSWNDSVSADRTSSKAIFVYEVLDRCIRLSFHKKVSTLVSGNLDTLVPPEKRIKYQPVHATNPKAQELEATIKQLIVSKADGKTIAQTLNILIEGVEMDSDFQLSEEKHSDRLLKIDIFTAVILDIAQRSLTHLSSAIGKFKNVFKALIAIDGGQAQLLSTMHSCLESHTQLQVILVDKLLKAELIEPKEVCRWIFSDPMHEFHLRSYPWEILINTTHRLSLQISKLTNERDLPVKEETTDKTEDESGDVEMSSEEPPQDKTQELDGKIESLQLEFDELVFLVLSLFTNIIKDEVRSGSYLRHLLGRIQQFYYANYEYFSSKFDKITTMFAEIPSIKGKLSRVIVNLNQ